MRTLSRLMIAAGVIGTMAGTGATTALAQGVYLQDRGSASISADLPTESATITVATQTMIARASTLNGDIIEVPKSTSVTPIAGVTAIGIREA